MYGSHAARSAYADLVLEAVEGGGLLVFVSERQGSPQQINLSPAQVAELRQWLAGGTASDRSGSVAPE